jgi:hypothetical protein
MADRLQRISIGFHGQALPARVRPEATDALRAALASGQGGWHELESEDGTVVLDLTKVVYVRLENHEPRVGFGLS